MQANLLNRTHYVVSAFMCTNHMKYKSECSHISTAQHSSLLGCVTVCVVPDVAKALLYFKTSRAMYPASVTSQRDMKHQITQN